MAKAFSCDNCGKLIEINDLHIKLIGYDVIENQESKKMPMGFEIRNSEEFCSFNCLSEWAKAKQGILEGYLESKEKHYGK